MTKLIDTAEMAENLRAKAIDVSKQQILISRIADSKQVGDLTIPPVCGGYGRIRHFKLSTSEGWPSNPLPIIPACKALGITESQSEMKALAFQNAACAWRCWYCFVPFNLLSADSKRSDWFSAEKLVKMYSEISDRPLIIDLTGGSPDLVPEWMVWMMDALREAKLDQKVFLWSDDNLSTMYLFEKLGLDDIDSMVNYKNYGRVCCLKGFDSESFVFNTTAKASDFDNQFEVLKQVLELDIDVYGYITLTAPSDNGIGDGIPKLLDRLQNIEQNFPLRIVPLQIEKFEPMIERLPKNPKF